MKHNRERQQGGKPKRRRPDNVHHGVLEVDYARQDPAPRMRELNSEWRNRQATEHTLAGQGGQKSRPEYHQMTRRRSPSPLVDELDRPYGGDVRATNRAYEQRRWEGR